MTIIVDTLFFEEFGFFWRHVCVCWNWIEWYTFFCNIVKISRDFEYYKYTVTTKADGTIELISEKLDKKSENNSTWLG